MTAISEGDFRSAIRELFSCMETIKTSKDKQQLDTSNAKRTQDRIKKKIIEHMHENKIEYIEIDGTYIHLKSGFKKAPMNEDFFKHLFIYYNNQNIPQLDPEEAAQHFAKCSIAFHKNLCNKTYSLAINKKRPLSAMLSSMVN